MENVDNHSEGESDLEDKLLNAQQGQEKLNQLILPTFPMYAEA